MRGPAFSTSTGSASIPATGRSSSRRTTACTARREGRRRVEPVGEVGQDIMGFSVVARDRFIGSGHPAPAQEDLPPNLGLIASRDRGRTWASVSLLGEADFHVLRSSGRRVYGFDGIQGRLMVSSSGGRDWQQRRPPAAMFDLAIAPDDPDRIVVSTERGLFASRDAGRRWRPLSSTEAGLLAWPQDGLSLVGADGTVQRSSDGGRHLRPRRAGRRAAQRPDGRGGRAVRRARGRDGGALGRRRGDLGGAGYALTQERPTRYPWVVLASSVEKR
jgi:hypothetical protein